MMTKTDKTKWIKALRSGKFLQGKGQLRKQVAFSSHVRFCCLGVLCEISPKKAVLEGQSNFKAKNKIGKYDIPDGFELNPFGISQRVSSKLVNMNDNFGNSFDEIANYISRNVKTK